MEQAGHRTIVHTPRKQECLLEGLHFSTDFLFSDPAVCHKGISVEEKVVSQIAHDSGKGS